MTTVYRDDAMTVKPWFVRWVDDEGYRQSRRFASEAAAQDYARIADLADGDPTLIRRLRQSVVYAIEGAGLTKIGTTADLELRLDVLQPGSPVALSVVGQWPGGRDLEMRLHAEFKDYRRHGEWFALPPDWRERIDAIAAQEE